jgi:allantoicase
MATRPAKEAAAAAAAAAAARPAFAALPELANAQVGGRVLFASDEWFASAWNLLHAHAPEWREGVFSDFGKWMDGWESRRKRTAGHDWCIVQLGIAGTVRGIEVDTSFFSGNYAPRVSVQAAFLPDGVQGPYRDILLNWPQRMGVAADAEDFKAAATLGSDQWEEIVPLTPMRPGYSDTCRNFLPVASDRPFTHLRLNMYPDGGIARLRVYGDVRKDWPALAPGTTVDLASVTNGGVAVAWSDTHYGVPLNMLRPFRGLNMGTADASAAREPPRRPAHPPRLPRARQATGGRRPAGSTARQSWRRTPRGT